MPCFHEDVFYIDMTEKDDFVNEKSQIVMACKNFQIGENQVVMKLTENNAAINSVGTVVNSSLGTTFNFGGDSAGSSAIYTFTFDVDQNCRIRSDYKAYLMEQEGYDGGNVSFFSMSMANVILPKIVAENEQFEPEDYMSEL
mmetsp:Transcript_42844/g.56633  ORF Transcript_42844/g.56633 Transcript_42844/m.56633 type:complete len:142 (-) Transcript_42844:1578-2003(-)